MRVLPFCGIAAGLGAALLLVAGDAVGHTRSESHSLWEVDGAHVDLTMTIPVVEADRLRDTAAPLGDARLISYLAARVYPIAAGQRCPPVAPPEARSALPGFRKYDFTFQCSTSHDLQIHSQAFLDRVPSHVNFAQVQNRNSGEFVEQLLTGQRQTVQVVGASGDGLKSARFLEFVRMGTLHILSGVDHLAFLLGLVLISRNLRDLVFVVTGFTLGHSLTLALAVTGVVRPHAAYIDALVALTIALIGAENVAVQTGNPRPIALATFGLLVLAALLQALGFGGLPGPLLLGAGLFAANYLMISGRLRDAGRLRMVMTLIFGLVHGFGFAADLLEMRLPPERLLELLFGFNLGVEFGQLALVAGATGLVVVLRRTQLALPRPLLVDVAATFLVALGTYWFVSRSYGL